uniref:Uncharacterized protein n=1 Tax=Anguilla anguilla TaxID=7936 RepID=A0A0E9TSC9_ANGAN
MWSGAGLTVHIDRCGLGNLPCSTGTEVRLPGFDFSRFLDV